MDKIKETTSISMGLDAIFEAGKKTQSSDSSDKRNSIIQESISKIKQSPYQPRKHFSEMELQELSKSIAMHGILQPLIVRKNGANFELVAGERRLRAAKMAALEKVPVILCDVNEEAAMAFALIENIQREDLNVIEESDAYFQLLQRYQLSHEELASRVGKSRSHITNLLRLRELAPVVRQYIIDGKLTMGHGRALLTLDETDQVRIAEEVIVKDLSVREAERLVSFQKGSEKRSNDLASYRHEKTDYWVDSLSKKFSSKVDVKMNKKGFGKITVYVESPEDLDWLVDNIKL